MPASEGIPAGTPIARFVRLAVRHGGLNLVLRGSTLAFRFLLSFYIVRFLGLDDAGKYGLAVGAVGVVPAAIGWGLNYFTAREVVGHQPHEVVRTVKTRIIVTIASLAAATVLLLVVAAVAALPATPTYALIVVLIWLETLSLDLYLPMIGLELSTQANIVVFVRTGLWVPAVIAVGLLLPQARSLDLVFAAWIASNVASLALLAWFLRKWPVRAALAEPFDGAWLSQRLRRSWYIYLSDLGIVGQVFLDRYIVNGLLGIVATGAYTFYWSLANSLQSLMQSTVVQLALPRMLKAYREPTLANWRRLLRIEIVKISAFALVLALGIAAMVETIVHFDRGRHFPDLPLLLAALLAAAVLRAVSDLLNVCITSTGRDRYYAATNVAGVVIALGSAAAFISLLGLLGAGVAALFTAGALVVMRASYLAFTFRRDVAARGGATA